MHYNYSDEFKELINSEEKLGALLKGIGISSDTSLAIWESMRSFIAKTIHKDGSFLDIGCGNGFLLRCLQEWSKYKIIPYGIDWQPNLVIQARALFPSQANNFVTADARDIDKADDFFRFGLPVQYDFVCWNVWDDWLLDNKKQIAFLKICSDIVLPSGKLILCFYDSDKDKDVKIENVKKASFRPTGLLKTTFKKPGKNGQLIWIEKND